MFGDRGKILTEAGRQKDDAEMQRNIIENVACRVSKFIKSIKNEALGCSQRPLGQQSVAR